MRVELTNNGNLAVAVAALLVTLAVLMSVRADDLTTDDLTVKRDAAIYGALSVAGTTAAMPTNGWLMYYSFSTNTTPVPDDSDNANTGGVTNATWTSSGVTGGAYSFDGSGDFINVANESDFDFERTNEFTITTWFKTSTSDGIIVSKVYNASPYTGFEVYVNGGAVSVYFVSTYPTNMLHETTTSTGYDDGEWHHVAVTHDGSSSSGGLRIYIDGSEQSTTVNANTLSLSTLNDIDVQIGRRCGYASWFFSGQLDEVIIYEEELSSTGVFNLYHSALAGDEAGVARFYEGLHHTAPLSDVSMGSYTNE